MPRPEAVDPIAAQVMDRRQSDDRRSFFTCLDIEPGMTRVTDAAARNRVRSRPAPEAPVRPTRRLSPRSSGATPTPSARSSGRRPTPRRPRRGRSRATGTASTSTRRSSASCPTPTMPLNPQIAADLRRAEVDGLRGRARRLPRRVRLRHPAAAEGPEARREAAGRRLPARPRRPAAATCAIRRRRRKYYNSFGAAARRPRLHRLRAAEPVHRRGRVPRSSSARPTRSSCRSSRSSSASTSARSTGSTTLPNVDPKRIAFYGLQLRRQDGDARAGRR